MLYLTVYKTTHLILNLVIIKHKHGHNPVLVCGRKSAKPSAEHSQDIADISANLVFG